MEDADLALTVIISSPVAAALNEIPNIHSLALDPLVILVGVAEESVAVPEILNEKSSLSKLPDPIAVLYASLKVTVNLV